MFQKIFDVFSARPEAAAKKTHEIPQTTRTRVLTWVNELYSGQRPELGIYPPGDYSAEFWQDVARRVLYRLGDTRLIQSSGWQDGPQAIMRFVFDCPGEQFLDFLEDIFSIKVFWHVSGGGARSKEIIDELNHLLSVDDLPYAITNFVTETVRDGNTYSVVTHAHPKVIMRETEVLHLNSTEPALTLLQRPHFKNANNEYLAALEDYRKGDYADCLTKCGSAFESVLKVICNRKGWPYKQTDTAKPLIATVISKTSLESYFDSVLNIVPILRNKMSSAHGAGTASKQPSSQLAQYALNATASAIILIARETGEY
jgi:hypothetical protein